MGEKVYSDYSDLVTAISKKTGVPEASVKKVLTESFASTKAYIIKEMEKGNTGKLEMRTIGELRL